MTELLHGTARVARGIAGAAGGRALRLLQRSSVAVLVDAENISARHFPQVVEAMRLIGHVREIRVYGPVSLLNSEAWGVAAAAYGARRVPCSGCKAGKNSADIRLAIDAMDLMASKRAVTFALVSDDTDFAPLARRLREEGRFVVGVGRLNRNDQYRKAFDEFVVVGGSPTASAGDEAEPVPPRALDKASRKCGIDARALMLAVKCARSGAAADSWCSMSTFGTLMRAEQPSFSTKRYGCKNLTDFVAKTGLFDMKGEQPHAYIRVRAA